MTFGVEKFKALLLPGTFTVLASYVVRLSDAVISGNMLGEQALSGVNLVGPCLSVISFVASLIATGCGTCYSLAMGRCERRRAHQYFMQALWTVLIAGGALAAALFFGRDMFLAWFGASADVTGCARDYLSWIWPVAVLEGLVALLVSLGYADGDARLCAIGYATIFVGNLLFSILGVKFGMGTAGCALGSVVAEAVGIAVLSVHFLRSSNSVAPVRHFSVRDAVTIMASSFGDAAAFLCDGCLFLFLNKFAIAQFGSGILPIVGVATALWGFLEFFNGVGVAIQPIVTVYFGERNTKAARRVMASAMRASLFEGFAVSVALILFPGGVVRLLGIEDAGLVARASMAVRWMAIGFVPLAFAGLFNSYYMFVERPLFAGIVTFLCYLVMPIGCVAVGSVFGETGLWAGMGAGPLGGVALASVIIVSLVGRSGYPLLLPRTREDGLHVFDLILSESSIVFVSRQVAGVLSMAGCDEKVVVRASLMVEEVLLAVRDRNGSRRVLAEATVDLNDGVSLTLRDDGEIFDITDADQKISSLRSFLVASMMSCHDGRMNLVTTGFNRNVFRFKKKDGEQ